MQAREPFVLEGGRVRAGGPGAAHRYFSILAFALSDSTKRWLASACFCRSTSWRMKSRTISNGGFGCGEAPFSRKAASGVRS